MSDRLQQAITVLQTRFGNAAPRPAEPAAPARSSGFPQVDELTGIGGWPVGRLGLLAGSSEPASGHWLSKALPTPPARGRPSISIFPGAWTRNS